MGGSLTAGVAPLVLVRQPVALGLGGKAKRRRRCFLPCSSAWFFFYFPPRVFHVALFRWFRPARAPHVRAALTATHHPLIEIHSENVFGGGPAGQLARELAARYPLSLQWRAWSGAVEPLDAEHLRALTTLVRAVRLAAVSEHLSFNQRTARW